MVIERGLRRQEKVGMWYGETQVWGDVVQRDTCYGMSPEGITALGFVIT